MGSVMAAAATTSGLAESSHLSDASSAQGTTPDPIKRFRSSEPKAVGVVLLMLGLIIFTLEVRHINGVPSSVIQTGASFIIAVLFVVTGSITYIGDEKPHQVLLRACLACAVLSVLVSTIELILYLVDLSKYRTLPFNCLVEEDFSRCYHLQSKQKMLYVYVPIFYLLTLGGTVLCIIVSISVYEVLRSWKPGMGQLLRLSPPLDVEGATLISPEPEHVPTEHPEPTPTRGTRDPRKSTSRAGKRPPMVQKFLEGKPKILGVIHLILGLTIPLLLLGSISDNPWEILKVGFNAWLTVQCIITGVVSIAAEDRPTVNMIRACLALNIISALTTAFNAFLLLGHSSDIVFCLYNECEDALEYVMAAFPLLFNLLELVISVVVATYARKSLRSVPLSKAAVVLNAPLAQWSAATPVGPQ
ncbi:uncharacterized protein LOC125449630 isoform X2 [Stegostoma tigrinum]|uniref:uncharacterized protein LOC125449630 isoform X2 n=1 Tax=Stegostoma tigrinum TaxID=3053191 RepID=UPI0028709C64|nr:uncharacterized protein LOC125449630 isoform X2 [Stegostoma tigrinum]